MKGTGCAKECRTSVAVQCQWLASNLALYCVLPYFKGTLGQLVANNPWLGCTAAEDVVPEGTTVCGQLTDSSLSPPPPPAALPPLPPPSQSPPDATPSPSPQSSPADIKPALFVELTPVRPEDSTLPGCQQECRVEVLMTCLSAAAKAQFDCLVLDWPRDPTQALDRLAQYNPGGSCTDPATNQADGSRTMQPNTHFCVAQARPSPGLPPSSPLGPSPSPAMPSPSAPVPAPMPTPLAPPQPLPGPSVSPNISPAEPLPGPSLVPSPQPSPGGSPSTSPPSPTPEQSPSPQRPSPEPSPLPPAPSPKPGVPPGVPPSVPSPSPSPTTGWPRWLPHYEVNEELVDQVLHKCPDIVEDEELLTAFTEPTLCPGQIDDISLVSAIGNGFYGCGEQCVFAPLASWPALGSSFYWTWVAARSCWLAQAVAGTGSSGGPCSYTAEQQQAWNDTTTLFWVAAALLDRLETSPHMAHYDPHLAELAAWFEEEVTNPGPGRNLTALGEVVLDAAVSKMAQEVLLHLPPGDPLAQWEAAQGTVRAADCDHASQDELSRQVVGCLCGATQPLLYCRALEAFERGWGVDSLVVRKSTNPSTFS
ncbi:hypothetical protein N2152v2_004188 [Parachlorella kessleri]